MRPILECVDAGSEFCPCYLAETGDCITCSHLQGKDFCDCNWRGVCIYQEYVMNGNKSKMSRSGFRSKIIEKERLSENCTILKLKVTITLARQLREPGAYIFLRDTNLPQYFDVPMSIMDTDDLNGYIYIAYQILGSKTKKLEEASEELLVRGPYWNAVYGLRYIKATKDSNCLIVTRGIAQAPSVLVAKKLIQNNNKVTMIVDKGKVGEVFIKDHIKELDLDVIEENLMDETGRFQLKNLIKSENYKLIYSGGSDLLHSTVIETIDNVGLKPYIVATNNSEICCGEGICGGCSTRLENGVIVKACKTQLDVRKAVERRMLNDD